MATCVCSSLLERACYLSPCFPFVCYCRCCCVLLWFTRGAALACRSPLWYVCAAAAADMQCQIAVQFLVFFYFGLSSIFSASYKSHLRSSILIVVGCCGGRTADGRVFMGACSCGGVPCLLCALALLHFYLSVCVCVLLLLLLPPHMLPRLIRFPFLSPCLSWWSRFHALLIGR